MTDIVDQPTRSRMMSGIKGKDTHPEMILRRALHGRGVRYRLHDKTLPGKPDLKMTKRRAVIFVHGCYWHQHPNCHWCTRPSSRGYFWNPKLEGNASRDARNIARLRQAGWRVAIVWECSLRATWAQKTISDVFDWLSSNEELFETRVVREREAKKTVRCATQSGSR